MQKIKSFKQYISDQKDGKKYILNTVFGKHSQDDKKNILNTVFGKHSQTDKKIDEAVDPSQTKEQIHKEHLKLANHYEYDGDQDEHDTEVSHISRYTKASRPLNSAMHERALGKDVPKHSLEDGMRKVVNKHKTPYDMTVYSGVRQSPEHLIKSQNGHKTGKGGEAHTSHFTSTSISKEQASGFAMSDDHSKYSKGEYKDKPAVHMLKIHVPKGHPSAYVAHHSEHENEKEMILPPNTKLHIHHTPDIEKDSSGFHTAIWHAHVIPHDKED